MIKRRFQAGYLLVEMLAVITLVGMVFAAVLPGLVPKAESIERSELVDRVGSFDEHARIAAIREGPLLLRFDAETGSLVLQGAESDGVLRQLQLDGVELTLLSVETGRPIRGVKLDRLGRSDAYSLLIKLRKGDPARITFSRYGHTTAEGRQ